MRNSHPGKLYGHFLFLIQLGWNLQENGGKKKKRFKFCHKFSERMIFCLADFWKHHARLKLTCNNRPVINIIQIQGTTRILHNFPQVSTHYLFNNLNARWKLALSRCPGVKGSMEKMRRGDVSCPDRWRNTVRKRDKRREQQRRQRKQHINKQTSKQALSMRQITVQAWRRLL